MANLKSEICYLKFPFYPSVFLCVLCGEKKY